MILKEVAPAQIVCLVDDDPAVLKSIGRLLASEGLWALTFNEPERFLEHVKEHSVPVVILDIWMEKMNGLEVQAALRAVSPETKVIVITGREDPAVRLTALQAGAMGFFIKPFDDNQFLAAVHTALGKRSSP